MPSFTATVNYVVINCWNCGTPYALTEQFRTKRQEDGKTFYCPNGHGTTYGDSEADILRRERDRLKQEQARLEEEVKSRDRQLTAQRAQAAAEQERAARELKRVKKREAAGTCPCCNRTFSNMATHMKHEHPGFVEASGAKVVPIKHGKSA